MFKNNSQFVIRGEWDDSLGEFNYWSEESGWTTYENSSKYDYRVFNMPLPPGVSGIVEGDHYRGKLIASYKLVHIPPPPTLPPYWWN